ncbi:hypothetical protein [Cryobacterium sp. Sr3]|uniref:hypothetical protein n=1 Tax=Cryobacterium sp. Sr3 TaxID=1259194 RepID=UPI00106C496A|nr:hypothetical protein [Cryobacterium sp. Sr3]TFB55467.1 hypothetical protein E3N94_09435 [Cryobacterium sp. Sr3]
MPHGLSVGVESIKQNVAVDPERSHAVRQGEFRFHSVIERGDCRQESCRSCNIDQRTQQTRDQHPFDLHDVFVGQSVVVPGDPVLRMHAGFTGSHEVDLVGQSADDGQSPQNSSRFIRVDGLGLSGGLHGAQTQEVPITIADGVPAGRVNGNATS